MPFLLHKPLSLTLTLVVLPIVVVMILTVQMLPLMTTLKQLLGLLQPEGAEDEALARVERRQALILTVLMLPAEGGEGQR